MMDFSNLRKEQKQALVLISMWIFGSVFALYQFVLVPFIKNRGQSTEELTQLRQQIQKAEVAMESESKLRAEYAAALGAYRNASEQYIVPTENPLSWVTEKAYSVGRRVGVDIQSVVEMGASSPMWDNLVKGERAYRPYTVRIMLECSYAQLVDLVRVFEGSNPCVCVSGITIAVGATPNRHNVSLIVEWPMWGRRVELGTVPGSGAVTNSV